ncbi:MAG: hypothetical protein B6U76_10110 [Desulfurococcales archaeon ex4484_217_2]|nr:MAG: hypothetical protein B6U76_10110 [Desulfurococcales archaeon ex4484_217_2]
MSYAIEELKIIVTLAFLTYTSILDIKYREVDLKVWFIFGVTASILTFLEIMVYGFTIINLIRLAVSVVLALSIGGLTYYLDLFGGADLFALIVLAIMHPWNPIKPLFKLKIELPFILTILINSLITYKVISKLSIPMKYKIAYMFLGFPTTIDKYLKMKFSYPLTIYEVSSNGGIKVKYRLTFSIEEEHYEHQEKLEKLVKKGLLKYDDIVWVTQGIPLLVFITLGYIISIIFGDFILCFLFTYVLKVPAC